MRRYDITYSIVFTVIAIVLFILGAILAFGIVSGAPDALGLVALGLASATLARLVP
jgi:hypothetical protein